MKKTIEKLEIENYILISRMNIDFKENFNVLIGESGAGKTIVIQAIANLFSKNKLESVINPSLPSKIKLTAGGWTFEKISDLKKNSFLIDGKKVSFSRFLTDTEKLVDISGQHSHQTLMKSENHLFIIDRFGKINTEEYKKNFSALKELLERKKELLAEREEISRMKEFYEFAKNEIVSYNLKPQDEEEFTERHNKLKNKQKIFDGFKSASRGLKKAAELSEENHGILAPLTDYDKNLPNYLKSIKDSSSALKDAAAYLMNEIEEFNYDDNETDILNEKLFIISRLKKKYSPDGTFGGVFDYLEMTDKKLSKFADFDKLAAELEKSIKQSEEKCFKEAKKISKARAEAAEKFTGKIKEELKETGFNYVDFKAVFSQSNELKETGLEKISFYISLNPGAPAAPLAQIASGGELSRVMLAVKSIIAGADGIRSIVFDEIDSGISGKIAELVGDKLAKISKYYQLIVITHLPAIASRADNFIEITKSQTKDDTKILARELKEKEEISKAVKSLIASGNLNGII